jgi:hypothetical protein
LHRPSLIEVEIYIKYNGVHSIMTCIVGSGWWWQESGVCKTRWRFSARVINKYGSVYISQAQGEWGRLRCQWTKAYRMSQHGPLRKGEGWYWFQPSYPIAVFVMLLVYFTDEGRGDLCWCVQEWYTSPRNNYFASGLYFME